VRVNKPSCSILPKATNRKIDLDFIFFSQDSLYELLEYGQIPPNLATEVLLQYDKAVNEALATRVKTRVNFHSEKLDTYRFCDNVWTFLLKVV
jgi:transcription initiation factor TFIIA small subunit